MAGLGEASAIISVAQVGISLSFTLISFIGDVRDARKRIKTVADEISLTAQRLKELGNLIEKNDRTKFFGEDSLESTFTLAKGCEVALKEIRLVLKKASVTVDPTEAKKDEIEIGSFSNSLWPWTKVQLGPPRADLATLKDDLQLLYLSVMANNASTAAEKNKYVQSIPGFYRSRQSAAAERDRALKRKSESGKQRPLPHSVEENLVTISDEEDLLHQEYDAFRERRLAEQDEKRIREQAELLKLEEEKKAREEEGKVKEIERRAVEEWKIRTAEDEEKKQAKVEENRDRLKKRLLQEHVSEKQIHSILENLDIEEPLSVQTGSGKQTSPNSNSNKDHSVTKIRERTPFKLRSKLTRMFSYLGKGSLRSWTDTSSVSSLPSSHNSPVRDFGPDIGMETRFEAWALHEDPRRDARVPLPGSLLEKHATKKICPSKSLLKRFSFLHPDYKEQVNKLIMAKNLYETCHAWFLLSLKAVTKTWYEKSLRRSEKSVCVLVVLGRFRTDYADSVSDFDDPNMSSRTRRRNHLPPSGSPNAGRSRLLRTHKLDPPAPPLGPSSAPPPPPPRRSVSIPPQRPPGSSGLGSLYHDSTIATRQQSSNQPLGPAVIESTRPRGPTKPWLSNYPPRPVPRSYNTGFDESRSRVSFATDEREPGPHSRRRRRSYGSASVAGSSSSTSSLADHTERTGTWEGISSNKTLVKYGDRDGHPPLRNTKLARHSKILPDTQRPGRPGGPERSRASATIDARSDSLSTSDDEHESATLALEKSNKVAFRKKTDKNKDTDQSTKEADEEIIKRYLTRYTSMHDVEVNASSHADSNPGIMHTESVVDTFNITGQVFDEPRTLDAELPTSVAGMEVLENTEIRPIDRSDSISLVVEPGPHMGSVSSSVVEHSSHEGTVPQLPPNTSILDRS